MGELYVSKEKRSGKGGPVIIVSSEGGESLRGTGNQWDILSRRCQGQTISEIMRELGVGKATINGDLKRMKEFNNLFEDETPAIILRRRAQEIGAMDDAGTLHEKIKNAMSE